MSDLLSVVGRASARPEPGDETCRVTAEYRLTQPAPDLLNIPLAVASLDGDRLVVTADDGYRFGFTYNAQRDYWEIDDPFATWPVGQVQAAAHFDLRYQADQALNGGKA